MSIAELPQRITALIENAPDASPLPEVLALVDAFVLEASSPSSSAAPASISTLEEQLRVIHKDAVATPAQAAAFLVVLARLRPVLAPAAIVQTWWDLVLRPALREPRLPAPALADAKALVIHAFEGGSEEIDRFRRRLMDLYLLDAFNEGSGPEVLEHATLDEEGREVRTCWKANLEDILVQYGTSRTDDFLLEVDHQFAEPSHRLQLLTLLNAYASHQSFPDCAHELASHTLLSSLFRSLLLDNSTTACTIGLTLLTKLLPIFAVRAPDDLKAQLPTLLAILARTLCWRERQIEPPTPPGEDSIDAEEAPELELGGHQTLHSREDLGWARLELAFHSTASPSPHQFFTFLYYLFPCNVIRFLRDPLVYLEQHAVESPYTVSWEDALDALQIKSKSESLLRGHTTPRSLIWQTAESELSEPPAWPTSDISWLVAECAMLDVRNAAIGLRERPPDPRPGAHALEVPEPEAPEDPVLDTPRARPRVSLQAMIATALALRSGREIELVDAPAGWNAGVFAEGDAESALSEESEGRADAEVPAHALQAIAGLQREVVLLRNELNFELWLNRENVRHVGRLYTDSVLSKDAEVEQQGLRNKLREFRLQVSRLQKELREQRDLAAKAKEQNKEWNNSLQTRLNTARAQARKWTEDTAHLRSERDDTKNRLEAQRKLLADAENRVFELQTKIKETAPKVDRLRDYERQIEQHTTMQRLWDDDVQKLRALEEDMRAFMSRYRKMALRVEALERMLSQKEKDVRETREQMLELESRALTSERQGALQQQGALVGQINALAKDKADWEAKNNKLRDTIADLRDEIEDLKARLEDTPESDI